MKENELDFQRTHVRTHTHRLGGGEKTRQGLNIIKIFYERICTRS